MSITTTVQGRVVRLLRSACGDGWALDVWEDAGHPVGHLFRTGVVFTGRMTYDDGRGLVPWGENHYGVAWGVEPSADPVERFEEALRQERQRAEERMTS